MEGESTGVASKIDTRVLSWSELMELGRSAPDLPLEETLASMAPNQACLLLYTSGTTGPPKGDFQNNFYFRRNCIWVFPPFQARS